MAVILATSYGLCRMLSQNYWVALDEGFIRYTAF